MKVLLGHSYFLRFDEKLWRAMQPYPPLGTLYAAAMLRDRGHEVRLFDAMLASSTEEWARMLDAERPEVAVLLEDNFNYLSKMCLLRMRDAAFEMVAAARARRVPVIVSGADVTDNAELYLDAGADYTIAGEGEQTLLELLDALSTGSDPAAVESLTYRSADEFISTPRRSPMTDLDSLPPPAFELIDLDSYRRAWASHGERFSLNLVSSRGCPFHCNWCAKPIWGQRYAVASPERVAGEIQRLRSLGATHLWFMDDILGIKPGWLSELADGLEALDAVTPFKCLSRADLLLRPGDIEGLRRAGCEAVWIGAESGSQKILDAMEKGTTVEQVREAARRLKGAGIRVAFFLQFGYPGETWDDIEATLQLVRDCDPDDIGISVSYPLPGTPFYERVEAKMTGARNWVTSGEMAMLYDGPYPTSFYRLLHARVHAEFRLQKARRGRGLISTATALLRRGQIRQLAGVVRDARILPVLKKRLSRQRTRTRHNDYQLPIELTPDQAGSAEQPEEVATAASR